MGMIIVVNLEGKDLIISKDKIGNKREVFQFLDELSNYELGLSKEEWCNKLTVVIDYLITEDDILNDLLEKGNTLNGSHLIVKLEDSIITIDYETSISNELNIEFDVFFGIVSHSGNVYKNGKQICKS